VRAQQALVSFVVRLACAITDRCDGEGVGTGDGGEQGAEAYVDDLVRDELLAVELADEDHVADHHALGRMMHVAVLLLLEHDLASVQQHAPKRLQHTHTARVSP
jgi:hypothetical protein